MPLSDLELMQNKTFPIKALLLINLLFLMLMIPSSFIKATPPY
jgi:hypothetical protein